MKKKLRLLGDLLPLLNPHPGQLAVLQDNHRFQVIAAGRRWGKSHVALMKAAQIGVRHPGSLIWVVSPNFQQQEAIFNKAMWVYKAKHRAFERADNPEGWFVKDQRLARGYRKLILFNDSILEFKSAESKDSLRGAGDRIRFVILDEAAYVDPYSWQVIRFALMDHQAPAFLISTPNAHVTHDDFFYKRWLWGQETIPQACPNCLGSGCERCNHTGVIEVPNPDKKPDYKSWRFSSYDNPYITNEEIDSLIEEEGYSEADIRREIYAEFIEGQGAVFALETIAACQAGEPEPYKPGCEYVMGIDFAKVHDYTVVIVIRVDTAHVVRMERIQGSWGYQREIIKGVYQEYAAPYTVVDATQAGDVLLDDLIHEDGLTNIQGYTFNGPNKMRLIDALRVAIEKQALTFPPVYQQIADELAHLSARKLPQSGITSYSAAKGYYDDCVMALALAWRAYNEVGGGATSSNFLEVSLLGA